MSFVVTIGGVPFDQFTEASVTRDLKEFAGSFSLTVRDGTASAASLAYASPPVIFLLRPGPEVTVAIDGETVLVGWLETVDPQIDEDGATVTLTGRDKTGDLIDSAAAAEGPGEFRNVTLDEAARRIAKPFGLQVSSEIEAGRPFPRYALDLTESGLSAIEKGARQRHALVLSDGVGGLVITRTGANRAPADLTLPGNIKRSGCTYSHEDRHSETIVRGQGERAAGRREGRKAALDATASPLAPADRQPGDGEATARERAGIAMTGRAVDPEITRHRPIVHLTRSQPDEQSVQDEADWRSRTARAESEDLNYTVAGFGANGRLWRVNELAEVDDAFQDIHRDMLISKVVFHRAEDGDETGDETELTLTSPEAFDDKPVEKRRTNRKSSGRKAAGPKKKAANSGGGTKSLDSTAEAL